MVIIYTTCKDTAEAVKLGNEIVKRKLAVCVNLWPIQAIWRDDGEVKSNKEATLLIKTNESNIASVEEFLVEHHSYSTPFIGAINVDRLNREYKEWMQGLMG